MAELCPRATNALRRPRRSGLYRCLASAILAVPLLAGGCAEDWRQQTLETSARLDRFFGTDGTRKKVAHKPKAATPAADTSPGPAPASRAERLYRAGLAEKHAGRFDRAVPRFQRAADLGHPAATAELGLAYGEGRGVARDEAAAARWLNLAADRGEPRAQYLVGAAFYSGLGVALDRERAAGYLGKAAIQGHADAQYLLARAFANGQGVPKDPAWAARWYAKAARQGQLESAYAYGVILAAGQGLPRDRAAGYRWVRIAEAGGHGDAAKLAPILAKDFSAGEQDRAEARAAAFKPHRAGRFADPPTVTYLQVALGGLGYDAGPVDGMMGPSTRSAIRAYQKDAGMAADGRLSPKLLERVFAQSKN